MIKALAYLIGAFFLDLSMERGQMFVILRLCKGETLAITTLHPDKPWAAVASAALIDAAERQGFAG